MFENVSKWAAVGSGGGGGGSRLIKAKSSPNVSKSPSSLVKKQSQSNQAVSATSPSKPPRTAKAPTISKISSKTAANEAVSPPRRGTANLDSPKPRLFSPSKQRGRCTSESRPDTAKTVSPVTRNNDKKKVCKSASSSPTCTILEDRALLKKGLIYTPNDKMPAKPEGLGGKATLDRSVSLGCVSTDNQAASPASIPRGIPISSERRSVAHERDKKAESPRRRLTPMNRSTSLWSVQTPRADYNQCRRSSGTSARLNSVFRPSKIPLPAARPTGLGRSLADLSQVDRVEESIGQVISFELDLDATSNERIYENCRETLDRASKLGAGTGISVSTSNLEERAARLMAQLEDDDEVTAPMDVVDVALPRRKESIYGDRETSDGKCNVIEEKRSSDKNDLDDCSDNKPRPGEESEKTSPALTDNNTKPEEDVPKRRESAVREYKSSRRDWAKSCEKPDEIVEGSKKSKESPNIQELRRNWERHSRGAADQDNDAKTTYTGNSAKKTVNLSKIARNEGDVVDGAQEAKRKQCVGKRAKDIEHLVNFFNCKNAEASKETPRETWIKPRSTDVPAVETPAALKKNEPKSGHEYSGYASDGNCSEDSGHMSNENEVEWKDAVDSQSQRETADYDKETREYYGAIDPVDDMKIFDTSIARRLAESEKMKKKIVSQSSPAVSSGASSIDSCRDDRCLEIGRQVRPCDDYSLARSLLSN